MADDFNINGTFQTSGQNMWGPAGSPTSFSGTRSAGLGFGAGVLIHAGNCAIACVDTGGDLNGSVGVTVNGGASGGTVGATVDFNSILSLPHTFQHNTSFNANQLLSVGNSQLATDGPGISASTALNASLWAGVHGGGCIAGACVGVGQLLVGTGNPPPTPPTPASFSANVFSLGGTLNGASGNGAGLVVATSQTTIASGQKDLGAFIGQHFGVPSGGGFGVNGPGVHVGVDYTLFSGNGEFDTTFTQVFFFAPTVTTKLFVVETGQTVNCDALGNCDGILTPGIGNTMTIIPKYFAGGTLSNFTGVSFDTNFNVNFLSATFTADSSSQSIGPLGSFSSGNISTPDIGLFSNAFALGGFQEIDGEAIVLRLDQPNPAPEPASLAMMLSGFGVAAGLLRRKRA